MPRKRSVKRKNIVVISDTHCGCHMGLCPPEGITLDDGVHIKPSKMQLEVWKAWREFWDKWVPQVLKGEPFTLVHNGDAIDGKHHGSTTQFTQNIEDQRRIAEAALIPEIAKAEEYYHIRGTEAHVGPSSEYEETLAKTLGAIPNDIGQHARHELWMKCGDGLLHFLHHIGTTGSSAYESTAVYKELVEAYVESGRWGDEPPQCIVRSHRHRNFECRVPCDKGYAMAVVTAGWQLKTPFVYKIPGGRQSQPQIGGTIIRAGDEDHLYTRHFVRRLDRPDPV